MMLNICIKLNFFYLDFQETERAVLKLPPNSEDDKEPDDAQEVKNNLPVLADDQIKEYEEDFPSDKEKRGMYGKSIITYCFHLFGG